MKVGVIGMVGDEVSVRSDYAREYVQLFVLRKNPFPDKVARGIHCVGAARVGRHNDVPAPRPRYVNQVVSLAVKNQSATSGHRYGVTAHVIRRMRDLLLVVGAHDRRIAAGAEGGISHG